MGRWEALWFCFPTLGGLITWFQKFITCQHSHCTERSANSKPPLSVDVWVQSAYIELQLHITYFSHGVDVMIQFLLWLKRSFICWTQSRVCVMSKLQWCLTNSAEETFFYFLIHLVRYSRLRQLREQMAKRKKYWTQKREMLLKTR